MSFTSAVTKNTVFGDLRVVMGTYTNDSGSTGGEIRTGLGTVMDLHMQPKGAAVVADASVVNETFPLANTYGDVTVVNTADEVGTWIAYGI
jgi:hypothetical protein